MSPTLTRARSLALAASAAAILPRGARAQAPLIRLGSSTGGDSYFQAFYAQEMGFFSKAGLNVEVQNFPSAGPVATAVAGNAVDVGFADPILVANAYNRGLPWAYFAGGGLYSTEAPTTVLCLAQNSPVRSAKEIDGKSAGVVALASISALGVRAWLESNGADMAQIKLIEMPYTTMVPSLNRGDIAAAFIAEPFFSQLKKDVRVWANAFDAIAPRFFITACFAPRSWIERNRDTAQKLTAAIAETTRWANTHRDESAVIVNKYSKIPLEVIKAMNRVRYADLDARLMQPVLDTAFKYKAIERPVNAADIVVKA